MYTSFKFLKINTILFLMFFSASIFSQTQPQNSINTDSSLIKEIKVGDLLKSANYYISKKEFKRAGFILSKYYDQFSENLKVNWLYAHVLSINNDKIGAKTKFNKAISIAPKNNQLLKEYARFLYQMGEIKDVESVLSKFIDTENKDVEFLLMQAKISFWKGDIKNSQKTINRIQEIYPNTEITKNLSEQIRELTAFYIKTNFEYQSDTQPMDYFAEHIVLGKYKSRFLNPKLEISNYNFSPQKEQAIIIKLSNQFYIDQLKLIANITGGVYKNFSGETDWVGGINFTQKLTKNASLSFGYSKNSLLGTITSTSFNLTNQDVFGALDYNHKLIAFHAGYNQQFFKDDNNIKSFASWIVSQPIKVKRINFQFGYGYNFSDSKDVLFVFDNTGSGVYDPYFTPNEQEIHSALFITNYKPLNKLTIEVKANYGFKATVSNPYPTQTDIDKIEIGGFYNETFTPIELNGSISYNFLNNFRVKATYTYQETFFYERNNINLELNYRF